MIVIIEIINILVFKTNRIYIRRPLSNLLCYRWYNHETGRRGHCGKTEKT